MLTHIFIKSNFWSKVQKVTGLEKISFHSNPKERQHQRMFKLPHSCTHSHASKVMLKLGFNSKWIENFQMFKLDLEEAEESEVKLPTSTGS